MNLAAANAAHAVVDVCGNLIAVTLNQAQAKNIARKLGPWAAYRPATEDDVAALGRKVDDDLA